MVHVKISSQALEDLIAHSKRGYESCYKKEVGGFLMGKEENSHFLIVQSVPYNTRNAGRTYWAPSGDTMKRKGSALEKQTGLKWIGTYHSHPETAGWASTRQSSEDRESHISSDYMLEIIVRVTPSLMNSPASCLSLQDNEAGYYYAICGYMKDGGRRTRRIKVVKT
jgi:proteasome lid subunit RPN8/RPN11